MGWNELKKAAGSAKPTLADEQCTTLANEEAMAMMQKLKVDKGALEQMMEDVRAERDVARAEREVATKHSEALKKQAEGLGAEYMRLQAENESLKNKLQDFEDLMGS